MLSKPVVNTQHRSGVRKALISAVATLLAVSVGAGTPVLTKLADVPLPGRATRFDYQSFDPKTKTLFIAHMGDELAS